MCVDTYQKLSLLFGENKGKNDLSNNHCLVYVVQFIVPFN